MVIILCECDWELGAAIPAHQHAIVQLVRRDDGQEFWVHGFIPQEGYTIVMHVEEIHFHVPWRKLFWDG